MFERIVGEARIVAAADTYLTGTRGIWPETLASPRFRGAVRRRGEEVIFPHKDPEGITGFERKHPAYKKFAWRGRRALWFSASRSTDTVLVVGESALDLLSFAQLFPSLRTRYASTGGTLSTEQATLFGRALGRLPIGGSLVIASDNDSGGAKF